jgi:5-methyltetrahydrofolate--homocysteine methyltransferase
MATVKGDVHDIGKNIVGVVLACNNYDVVDLGVLVPCDRILAAAIEKKADVIGLSGLITPSLDEMVHVAKEMRRTGCTLPLLIGGATTSAAHTAVRIAPEYAPGVVHVLDASRVVNVVSSLLSPESKAAFMAEVGAKQEKQREEFAARRARKPLLSLPVARDRRQKFDWAMGDIPRPDFLGARTFTGVPLEEIVPFIDWGPFFSAWELHGRYPDILRDEVVGAEATKLLADGKALLERIVKEKRFTANAVIGFWPCNAVGDDVEVYADEARSSVVTTFHMLRQQQEKPADQFNHCLADYIAPRDSGRIDYIGPRRRAIRGGVPGRVRRLQRNHEPGAGRPACRGDGGDVPQEGARGMRVREDREPGLCRLDSGKVPRHQARPGISRVPRPHGEAHPLPPPWRRGRDRHRPDRELRHDASQQCERLVPKSP